MNESFESKPYIHNESGIDIINRQLRQIYLDQQKQHKELEKKKVRIERWGFLCGCCI